LVIPIVFLTDPEDVLNPALKAALTVIPLAACVTGTISIIKSKERCIPVFVSTALGFGFLVGAIGNWYI
jgi:hypothetical protein